MVGSGRRRAGTGLTEHTGSNSHLHASAAFIFIPSHLGHDAPILMGGGGRTTL